MELSRPVRPTREGVQITLPGGAVATLPEDGSAELVTAAIRTAAAIPAREAGLC